MNDRSFARRVFSTGVDVVAFGTSWVGVCYALALVLGPGNPDNPWGLLVVCCFWAFPLTALLLGLLEATTGTTLGRTCTGLRLVDQRRRPLLGPRLHLRAALKTTLIAALAFAGLYLNATGHLAVLAAPLLFFAVVNALACVSRADGRSLLDAAAGSRSVL